MITGQNFFTEAVKAIPRDTKKQVEWSMGISDYLSDILQQRGMSQKQFAKQVGRSEAEVSRWLAGLHNFTLGTLAKISTVLGVDLISVAR